MTVETILLGIIMIIACLLGAYIPSILYAGSNIILIKSIFFACIKYFSIKRDIIQHRKNDLNNYANKYKYNTVNNKQVRYFVYNYERYQYSFNDIIKSNIICMQNNKECTYNVNDIFVFKNNLDEFNNFFENEMIKHER